MPIFPFSQFLHLEAYPNDPYFAKLCALMKGAYCLGHGGKRRRPQWLIVLADHGEGRVTMVKQAMAYLYTEYHAYPFCDDGVAAEAIATTR